MAVAAAEQLVDYEMYSPLPVAVAVPELAQDELIRHRAARFIGAVATTHALETESVTPIDSLYDALQLAATGNAEARQLVMTNVRTDVVERTIKSGHVTKVELTADADGSIQQYGQSLLSVQANSLRFNNQGWQMRERTEAEATNAFRLNEHFRSGTLEDHYFVVFSPTADNMSTTQMDEVGFFTDTMSCGIQVTTAEDDHLTTETAFVAGVAKPGKPRHDVAAIVSLAAQLDVDLAHKSTTEILATPLLIPKTLMPNGAIDLVERYDQAVGDTFFGEARPQQDYQQYRQQCYQREAELQPRVNAIAEELIATLPEIHDRLESVKALEKLSGKHMVDQAVVDTRINPRVFGHVAAQHIEAARWQLELGNVAAARSETVRAQKTEQSRSCPTGVSQTASSELSADSNSSGKFGKGEDKYGSLTFKCQRGHTNVRPHGKLIPNCRVCGISVKC